MQGKLLTKERLRRLGIGSDCNVSVLCEQQQVEDATHLFYTYELSKIVWHRITSWLEITQHNRMLSSPYSWLGRRGGRSLKKKLLKHILGQWYIVFGYLGMVKSSEITMLI